MIHVHLFSRYLLLCLIILGVGACNSEKEAEQVKQHPNIIWLVAEDQSPDFFPMYGDHTISLPNIESLSTDGVVFNNAFSPVPVCAPARSALITGMYPTSLGTHNMRTHAPWRGEDNKPYPNLDIPSYSPIVPDGVKMFTEYLRKQGYYCANGPKEDYNFARTDAAWDESSKDRHWRKRNPNQPFFAVFNFSVCHESQIWTRGKDSLFVDPSKVPIPPYFPDTEVVRHDLAVNYSNLKRLDDQVGEIIAQLKEDGLYEDSIIFFYGDHGGPFPRHKRALYDSGIKVPLTIKFPKNEKVGNRDDRLISFIDFAPTVLSMAGIEPPRVIQGKAQFGKYEVAKKAEYTFHSSDRFDELYDRLRAVRSERYKYIKSFNTSISHAIPNKYRKQMSMMRELNRLYNAGKLNEKQSLWLHPTKPTEELYDLKQDPYELNNLAELPELRDTLMVLRNVLNDWIKKTRDLGQFEESELISKWLLDGKQPQLPPLEMEEKEAGIRLVSKNTDATIVWKQLQDSTWTIYDDLIPLNIEFEAKAERIGYLESDLLSNK